jgi:hypothetical protein
MGRTEQPAASHPGRVKASVWRVAASYPFWPLVLGALLLVSLLAFAEKQELSALLLVAAALYANVAWWRSARGWFHSGDACPASIVSVDPLLVATMTDLSAGDGAYPAIKVRREPRRRWSAAERKVGQCSVCIARYDGVAGALHWTNFHPRPVPCATSDESEVRRLLGEVDPQRWAALEATLAKLPQPIRPGLYRLDAEQG